MHKYRKTLRQKRQRWDVNRKLTEQLLWLHLSSPLWISLPSGWRRTSAGGLQRSNTHMYTHILGLNTKTVRCQMAWKCTYNFKHTCFSLPRIMNLGRQPRVRADPQRVSIWGLFSPSMYWDTRTSTHVHADKQTACRDYCQTETERKIQRSRKLYWTYLGYASQPALPRPRNIPHTRQRKLPTVQPAETGGRAVRERRRKDYSLCLTTSKEQFLCRCVEFN